ncbi:hypothetical protein N0V92_009162 [Colletotrichum tropicale]|nr:hypothetical protein N0V92_009162 [Colletotrichum tropicale]
MHSFALALFLLVSFASAAPLLNEHNSLNSTKWHPDHVLQPHEVILYGEGRMEVVHRDTYDEMIKRMNVLPSAPSFDHSSLRNLPVNESLLVPLEGKLEGRDQFSCDATTSVVTDSTVTFIDWDVQMSPVVTADLTGMDIFVMKGYTVTNTVAVGADIDIKWIKDKLGTNFGVNFARSWSTQTTVNIKGTVSPGYSGCMITKPFKTRRSGRVFTGCPGSLVEKGTWMADAYKEGGYEGVSWVSGTITICQKNGSIPLSRCEGDGDFI